MDWDPFGWFKQPAPSMTTQPRIETKSILTGDGHGGAVVKREELTVIPGAGGQPFQLSTDKLLAGLKNAGVGDDFTALFESQDPTDRSLFENLRIHQHNNQTTVQFGKNAAVNFSPMDNGQMLYNYVTYDPTDGTMQVHSEIRQKRSEKESETVWQEQASNTSPPVDWLPFESSTPPSHLSQNDPPEQETPIVLTNAHLPKWLQN